MQNLVAVFHSNKVDSEENTPKYIPTAIQSFNGKRKPILSENTSVNRSNRRPSINGGLRLLHLNQILHLRHPSASALQSNNPNNESVVYESFKFRWIWEAEVGFIQTSKYRSREDRWLWVTWPSGVCGKYTHFSSFSSFTKIITNLVPHFFGITNLAPQFL